MVVVFRTYFEGTATPTCLYRPISKRFFLNFIMNPYDTFIAKNLVILPTLQTRNHVQSLNICVVCQKTNNNYYDVYRRQTVDAHHHGPMQRPSSASSQLHKSH